MVRSASCASRTMRPRFPLQPSFETRANARSSEPDRKCIQHFQALSNHLKMILFFVMAGQKREARLRARCPGHPRFSCCGAVKTWMPGTSPGMTSFAIGAGFNAAFQEQASRWGAGNLPALLRRGVLVCHVDDLHAAVHFGQRGGRVLELALAVANGHGVSGGNAGFAGEVARARIRA